MKGLFFVLILVFATTASAQTVAFTNVNVIPMDRERVLAKQTVVVRNGVIAEIGDTKKVKVPKDAVRIDGTGKYLVPGLVDMHTHLLSDSDEFPDSIGPDELRVMVANGVTTVRFMIGTPELLSLRSRSAKGEIDAPSIFVASPHLTGREQGNNFVVNTPEEAREAVRKSKAAGYDFIKVTTFVKPEVYEAAVDEAAKQNIRVVGHADSRFVGVERAWKAKQQIEHLDGYMELLLRADAPVKGSVSDLYIYNPENWKSFEYMDESKIPEIARKTVESNPFVNPTHHFMKNSFGRLRTEEEIRKQPDFRFYPAKVQQQWLDFYKKNRFINTVSLEQRARWVQLREKLIKAIHDAGGHIMTGSDTPEFFVAIRLRYASRTESTKRRRSFKLRGARSGNEKPVDVSRNNRAGRHHRKRQASRSHAAKRQSARRHLCHAKSRRRDAERKVARTTGVESLARRRGPNNLHVIQGAHQGALVKVSFRQNLRHL